jgi:hypothetical protein
MKSFCTSLLTLVIGSFLFLGCASDQPKSSASMPPSDTAISETTTTTTETTTATTSTEPVTPVVVPTDNGSDQPIPLSKLPTKKGYPYAIKTKWPGLVKSPYAQDRTLVNVEGMTSGSPARCPHTGKIFIVP